MKGSQSYIKSFYPDFFDKEEDSNFSQITHVLSVNKIKEMDSIQHLKEEIQLFDSILSKERIKEINTIDSPLLPIFIHTTQKKPYRTKFHFVCIARNIKDVYIQNIGTGEIIEETTIPENAKTVYYKTIIEDDEYISQSKFKFIVTTYDEFTYIAESDKINENIDKIGKLLDVPRREYVPVDKKQYPYTDPPFCDNKIETDYNYVCRMYESIQRYKNDPLPVWHLWKKYGINSTLKNRKRKICRFNRSYLFRSGSNINIINKFDSFIKKVGETLSIETVAVNDMGDPIKGKFGVYIRTVDTFKFYGDVNNGIHIEYPGDIEIITRYFNLSEKFPNKYDILDEKNTLCSNISKIEVV